MMRPKLILSDHKWFNSAVRENFLLDIALSLSFQLVLFFLYISLVSLITFDLTNKDLPMAPIWVNSLFWFRSGGTKILALSSSLWVNPKLVACTIIGWWKDLPLGGSRGRNDFPNSSLSLNLWDMIYTNNEKYVIQNIETI